MLPTHMTVIGLSGFGDHSLLKLVELPCPRPESSEVLIKVAAAGVNRGDIVQRQGFYPPPPGAPDTLGLEVGGVIAAVGSKVRNFHEGDNVCALLSGGGYAQYCVAHEATVLPVPKGFGAVEAAALPEAFMTVWTNLYDSAHLAEGESLLVHGGASGIGTAAIALASARGVRVFATVGSEEKRKICEELGAERAVNYRKEDFVAVCRAATGEKGVDVILDMVGGEYVQRNLALAAPLGRIVNIAFMAGHKVELNLLPIMLKRLTLTGSTLRARRLEEKTRIAQAVREEVWPLLESGRIKPVIDQIFPLADAAQAHRRMEESRHIGKILLKP
jgi:NADPH2:quinone reductase